jgi:hypothetical protein
LGPTPYLDFSNSLTPVNSPFYAAFSASQFSYFHLETFEDGALNTPGVTASTGGVTIPGPGTDSVDGDDGVIDGSGALGRSFEFFTSSVTFTFSGVALGGLPTHVGLVWTDCGYSGYDNVLFEAFDAWGASLGVLPGAVGDGTVASQTAEDRFFGVIHAGGISKVTMHVTMLDTEVDHLQYGRIVPAPGVVSVALFGSVLACRRRR